MKQLELNGYTLEFVNGGVNIKREEKLLYFNKRPIYVFVKNVLAITEFYDKPYDKIEIMEDQSVVAYGVLVTPNGSELKVSDVYEKIDDREIKISRDITVMKAADDDTGFASKLSFILASSDNVRDYNCFAPANWYLDNEYGRPYVVGFDPDCEYFWRRETGMPLPLFAAQNKASGEMIMFSRWAADLAEPSEKISHSNQIIDPDYTIGSLGLSKPENKTINYLYYGFPLRKEIPTMCDGLSIDYVYPAAEGQIGGKQQIFNVDYMMHTKSLKRVLHPMKCNFSDHYTVALKINCYDGFYPMMRDAWRSVYARIRDDLFEVDQKLHYTNCMQSIKKLVRDYGDDEWGLPFNAFLPNVDSDHVSFQFGFVGQQPGIGYQLMCFGVRENDQEALEKGINIIKFWVKNGANESGSPNGCYSPVLKGFEPYPIWLRMSADGLENILDAYVLMRKNKQEMTDWLGFCINAAEWLIRVQNEDGSFYRAYNPDDSMRMDSKANTISVVRFLVQLYLVTGDERYREAALKAGEWAYNNVYLRMEYRGSTCDNADVLDNESGIYAMFGFLALYDLTEDKKWLDALIGAADYTETWTYSWAFPIKCPWPSHPFTKNSYSGQSPVTIGDGGGDMYMAACAYIYYRLYIITGDDHYRDYAEFIHNNTRQANDVDGSFGYALPGLSYEGGHLEDQILTTPHHWLPWVTYVEIDPTARLLDTFGAYDIAGAQKLSPEERAVRNRIYDTYAKF